MSDYPPGTFGHEFDRLDGELARLAETAPFWFRWYVSRRRRRLAEYRERLRRDIPRQLEQGGFITTEQRLRMEDVDRQLA